MAVFWGQHYIMQEEETPENMEIKILQILYLRRPLYFMVKANFYLKHLWDK